MDRGAWWATVLGNHRVGHKWTPNTKVLEVKPSTYEFCWDTIQLIMYSILSLSYLTFSCLFYFVSSGTAAFPTPVCWYMYFLNTKYLIISLHSTLWSEEQDMPFVVVFEACIVDQLSYSKTINSKMKTLKNQNFLFICSSIHRNILILIKSSLAMVHFP